MKTDRSYRASPNIFLQAVVSESLPEDPQLNTDGDGLTNDLDDDDDGDCFSDVVENWLLTDPLDNCPDYPSNDAWPPDINMDGDVSFSLDVMLYSGKIGQVCTQGVAQCAP